jgi:preprotein translocase subunit SecY
MSEELIKRSAFTLGALLAYWIGLRIPLPGIDVAAWMAIFDMQAGGVLRQGNALSGGGLRTLGVLSLTIMPYVTSAIIMQVLSMVSRRVRALADEERGRGVLERYTLAATAFVAALQAYGIAIGLEGAGSVVSEPGILFRLMTVLTLTAGTLFLVWLAGQITACGIGNGIALIIAAGIVYTLPGEIAKLLEATRQGILAPGTAAVVVALTAIVTAIVVVAERARRRLPVEFAERRVGMRQTADIALKLNPAGLFPTYLTSILLSMVVVAATLAALYGGGGGWADRLRVALDYGMPLHLVVTAALIAFFTLFYTAFVCDPDQMAARLAACGGALPGIAPGEATAAHLDSVISRTAVFGAAYLAFVMLLPEFLAGFFQLPIATGGTSILVLVCVFLDLAAEIRAYLAPAR